MMYLDAAGFVSTILIYLFFPCGREAQKTFEESFPEHDSETSWGSILKGKPDLTIGAT